MWLHIESIKYEQAILTSSMSSHLNSAKLEPFCATSTLILSRREAPLAHFPWPFILKGR